MKQSAQVQTGIAAAELRSGASGCSSTCAASGLTGYVLFDQDYIQYFTGFCFLSTERPVVFAQSAGGETACSCPSSRSSGCAPRRRSSGSSRTPSTRGSSIRCGSSRACSPSSGSAGAIGADQDGYPGILGYQGPALSEVAGGRVAPLAAFIESMMVRKSESEIALIRESARWCEHAHRLLQEYTRVGVTEARGEPAGGPRGDARDARDAR